MTKKERRTKTGTMALGVVGAALAAWAGSSEMDARVRADFPGARAKWVHYAVPAMSNVQRLPDAYPADGAPGGTNRIVLARGEYEPASILLYAFEDLGKVQLTAGLLVNERGDVFPSDGLDLKLVKCWYQNGNAWYSYFGDTGNTLVPELLLNDEDLIRVDTAAQANYARLVAADGTVREKWLNAPPKTEGRYDTEGRETFRPMTPEFRDAPSLRPVRLAKGEFRNFFLTARATAATRAGTYRGAVRLSDATGAALGELPVEVRVLDFDLPAPKAYREPARDFLVASYSYIWLGEILRLNGGDLDLARRQYRAVLANQVAHNQSMHWLRGDCDEEVDFVIRLIKEVGMRTDVFIGGVEPGGGYWKKENDLNYFRRQAKARREYFDAKYGHHNVYMGIGDEPGPQWIMDRREDVYRAYAEQGFKFIMAGWDAVFAKGCVVYDWANVAGSPTGLSSAKAADRWKQTGDKAVAWYASHHVGPENPDFNRRQNGLGAYLNGFNALCNYAHHFGPYNDRCRLYRAMVLAYGVYGGVLDTLAWEGFREGVDDIRYATLLGDLARQAERHGDFDVRRKGLAARAYVASLDPATCDQNAFRAEAQRWIVELKAAVAAAPKPVPAFVPPADEKERARQTAPIVFGQGLSPRDRRFIPSEARAEIEREVFFARGRPQTDTNGIYRACLRLLGSSGDYGAENLAWLWDVAMGVRPNVATNFWPVPFRAGLRAADAFCRLGDFAAAARVADVACADTPQMKPEERFELLARVRLSAAAPADVPRVWAALVASFGEGVGQKARERALCEAAVIANARCASALVRALEDVRLTFVRTAPTRTYVVRYSERPLRGPSGWDALDFRPERQPMDRTFGGSTEMLYTDVSSGARAVAGKDASEALPPPTLEVVADDDGLHFRFVAPDPKAREVELGLARGGSYEFYLAPGAGRPYVCVMAGDVDEAGATVWSTMYTTEGHRRLETEDHALYRVETHFDDGAIVTTADFSWRAYATCVPTAGDVWEFENLRWCRTGSQAWNGLNSVHGRSTWGRLRFDLPPEARARILRRQLFRARRIYEAAKGLCGTIGKWNDPVLGDVDFYARVLKPFVARQDELAAQLTASTTDEALVRLAEAVLSKWLCLEEVVGRLRTDYLNASHPAETVVGAN